MKREVSVVGAALLAAAAILGFGSTAAALTFGVPSTFDNTCTRDVTQPLATWLRALPDGTSTTNRTVVLFPPGCYRIDGTLELFNRHHIALSAAGAVGTTQLRAMRDAPRGTARAQLQLNQGNDIRVTGLTMRGSNPDGGGYSGAFEHDHNVAIMGATHVRLYNLNLLNAHGDGVQVSPGGNWNAQGVGAAIPGDIRIRGSVIRSTGRHGVTCTACDGLSVESSSFDLIGYHVFDQEAEAATWPTRHIRLVGNRIGSVYLGFYAGVSGYSFDVSDIVIAQNVMTGARRTCFPAIAIGSPLISPKGVSITGNDLLSLTGAFFLTNASNAQITSNRASGQGSCNGPGGAVVLTGGNTISVTNNVFYEAVRDVDIMAPVTNLVRSNNQLR